MYEREKVIRATGLFTVLLLLSNSGRALFPLPHLEMVGKRARVRPILSLSLSLPLDKITAVTEVLVYFTTILIRP